MGGIRALQNGIKSPTEPGKLLQDCLAQLSEELTFAPVSSSAPRLQYGSFFQPSSSCIDKGTFFEALLHSQWLRASGPTSTRTRYGLLAGRLVSQWAELHAFIAREALNEVELEDTSLTAAVPFDDIKKRTVSPEAILNALDRSWLVIFGSGFENLPASALVAPDYRFGPLGFTQRPPNLVDQGHWEAPFGAVPMVLNSLTTQLEFLEAYVAKAVREGYASPTAANGRLPAGIERALFWVGKFEGITLLAEARVRSALNNVRVGLGYDIVVPWEQRMYQTRDRVHAVRSRIMGLAAAARSRQNPLGISDQDLPLFFGDVSGNSSRYFASSDYLLTTWAVPAVSSAQGALATARDAWISKKVSSVQTSAAEADKERRVEDLKRQYGSQLLRSCGSTSIKADGAVVPGAPAVGSLDVTTDVNIVDVLSSRIDKDDSFAPIDQCFLDQPCQPSADRGPEAAAADRERASKLTNQAIRLALCGYRYTELKEVEGPGTIQCKRPRCFDPVDKKDFFNRHPSLKYNGGIVPGKAEGDWDSSYAVFFGSRPIAASNFQFDDLWKTATIDSLTGTFGVVPGTSPQRKPLTDVFKNPAIFRNDYSAEVQDRCQKELELDRYTPIPDAYVSQSQCRHGDLGALYNQLETAKIDLEIASAELVAMDKEIRRKIEYCYRSAQLQSSYIKAREKAEKTKKRFDRVVAIGKIAARVVAAYFSGGMSEAMVAGASEGGTIKDLAFEIAVMDGLNQSVKELKDEIESHKEVKACFDEAWNKVDRLPASLGMIKRRAADINDVASSIASVTAINRALYKQAVRSIEDEKKRPIGTFAHHFWFDEKVDRYKREFQWSKRLTYLALRAVEFEFQQTFDLRKEIIAATHPDQLETVVRQLQTEQAGRTINRRRPEEATVVLSLRDDVLKVEDRSLFPVGERRWSSAQRFAERLWDPRFAIRDDKGKWIGQGIPFALNPTEDIEHRCGERLWRVNATIQGDGLSEREPGMQVLVLQRNSFYSKWCKDRPTGGKAYQFASISPSSSLFRTGGPGDPGAEVGQFSSAMMYPWFNVRRAEFFKDAFTDGSSEELAGRGLWGDYIVLFPKALLNKGFPLNRVEDVLLRLDYLSVENLGSISRYEVKADL